MSKNSILIVEDEYILARDLQSTLRSAGYEVPRTVGSAAEAICSVESFRPDLVLMDVQLQGSRDGISVAQEIRERFSVPVIYLTSYSDETVLNRARATTPIGYVLKPYEPKDLLMTIDMALNQHQATLEKNRAALHAQETRFRTLLESINGGLAVMDSDGRIVDSNEEFCSLLGYSFAELHQKTMSDLLHPDDLENEIEMMDSMAESKNRRHSLEQRYRCNGGKVTWMRSTVCTFTGRDSRNRGLLLRLLEDITVERSLKEKLIAAQRMKTMDSLTSGLAHNLNNLLTPLTAGLQLLRSNIHQGKGNAVGHTMDSMDASLKRATYILRQLLNCSRDQEQNFASINLSQTVREVAVLAREFFPETITIKSHVDPELWNVFGNADQIHQALLNLCINARDAMPSGGKLSIQGENVVLNEADIHTISGGRLGAFVLLSVTDTGAGMSSEVKERIFQPFFTTKPRGSGTGLGLATTLGIIKNHEGFLDLTTQVDKGTEFRLYLPAQQK
jgi:PAS domain S-box-containing protein